jgi:hypothetical protein
VALGVLALAISFAAVFGALKLAGEHRAAAVDSGATTAAASSGHADGALEPGHASATASAIASESSATPIASRLGADRPGLAGARTAATTATTTPAPPPPSGTPVPTVVAAPATVASVPMGGRAISSAGMNFEHCHLEKGANVSEAFSALRPSISACFAAAQFDPPIHENRDYDISYDATGHVTRVTLRSVADNDPVPRLDACIGIALKTVVLPVKDACTGSVYYAANCVPNTYGKCGKPPP